VHENAGSSLPQPSFLARTRICTMSILFHSFTHGMLAFLVAESLMLAVLATPISSWASAQTVLLGHEVP